MTEPTDPSRREPPPAPDRRGRGEPFRILFVCTGNTCRSPLAEALARRAVGRLGWGQVEVTSHRSARVTRELVEWADLVLTMSPDQLVAVRGAEGTGKASVITDFAEGREAEDLDDEGAWGGVPDPAGGDDEEYEQTYRQLSALVDRVLDRLAPLVAP
jgi:protein-tyrosine-phosphatase